MGTDRESPFWKMFAVVIQLGAILSVVVFFRSRLLGFAQSFWTAWNQAATPAETQPHPARPQTPRRTTLHPSNPGRLIP